MSNLIHRIWIGSKIPVRYKEYGQQWHDMNPDYNLVDWTDDMLWGERWENQHVLEVMKNESKHVDADMVAFYTHVADVVDYELIYRYGGWYFNTDMKPIKPLEKLGHSMHQAGLAMEDNIHPVNMAMYAPPKHPFFEKIIELLPKRYFGMPGAFMNATTGVQLIEHALRQYKGPEIRLFHRNVFNPIHWSDFGYGEIPDINRQYPEETVAIHEWLHRSNMRGQRILEV